ncbi:MAG: metallophosphoesterase family protein [Phycisphaerae bacterium]
MIAIISDIHGNLEALTAVLGKIDELGCEQVVCLGDVVGYGPDPVDCLDVVRARCDTCLMGNHDFAVMYEPYNFNTSAEAACFWTRRQLQAEPEPEARKARWKFLGELPVRHVADTFLAVHASPRRPVNEYIFPDDIYTNPAKFGSIFERVHTISFCGHTHVPGVFLEGPDFYSPDELDGKYPITDEKAVINVGSVGQPRDRDPRASFVTLSSDAVQFYRVPYDVQTTVKKVEREPALDNFLGSRLLDGR